MAAFSCLLAVDSPLLPALPFAMATPVLSSISRKIFYTQIMQSKLRHKDGHGELLPLGPSDWLEKLINYIVNLQLMAWREQACIFALGEKTEAGKKWCLAQLWYVFFLMMLGGLCYVLAVVSKATWSSQSQSLLDPRQVTEIWLHSVLVDRRQDCAILVQNVLFHFVIFYWGTFLSRCMSPLFPAETEMDKENDLLSVLPCEDVVVIHFLSLILPFLDLKPQGQTTLPSPLTKMAMTAHSPPTASKRWQQQNSATPQRRHQMCWWIWKIRQGQIIRIQGRPLWNWGAINQGRAARMRLCKKRGMKAKVLHLLWT